MAPRCEIPAWQIPIILCIKFKPQIHHAYNHGQLSIFQLGSCRKGGKKRSGVRIGNGKSREKASTKSAHAMLVKKTGQIYPQITTDPEKNANLTRSKGGVPALDPSLLQL